MDAINQGSRVSAGLRPVEHVSSLKNALRPVLAQPTPLFLDAVKDVEAAGTIPDIMDWAETILDQAKDDKMFGKLKNDPLSEDGIAYFQGYLDEGTIPPLKSDLL